MKIFMLSCLACMVLVMFSGCVAVMDNLTGLSSQVEYKYSAASPKVLCEIVKETYPDVSWSVQQIGSMIIMTSGESDFDSVKIDFYHSTSKNRTQISIYVWKNYMMLDADQIYQDMMNNLAAQTNKSITPIVRYHN